MRDDFNNSTKETLAKRVALLCSNPNCKCLTVGPNSMPSKTINIGVASHISAASEGGPRYNKTLTPEERSSIENAIWLCQSCAKLIDSDPSNYTTVILKAWKADAEMIAENQLKKRLEPIPFNSKLLKQMPALIKEMSDDVKRDPLAREFVLLEKGWIYNDNRDILVYYYDDHESLDKKIRALETSGFIINITFNNTSRYLFTEEFVEILSDISTSNPT